MNSPEQKQIRLEVSFNPADTALDTEDVRGLIMGLLWTEIPLALPSVRVVDRGEDLKILILKELEKSACQTPGLADRLLVASKDLEKPLKQLLEEMRIRRSPQGWKVVKKNG